MGIQVTQVSKSQVLSAYRSSLKQVGMLEIIPKSIESPMTCDDVEIPNVEIFNIGSSLLRLHNWLVTCGVRPALAKAQCMHCKLK